MNGYFAPAFEVHIDGMRAHIDVEKAVTEVSVSLERDAMDSFTLALANPFPTLRWTHTADANLFAEGSSVTIKLGYTGSPLQPVFEGEITSISPSYPDSGVPIVRIAGMTRLHRLHQDRKIVTFTDKTDSEIAEAIAKDLGLSATVDATSERHHYLIQMDRTDLDFLLERARRINYRIWVDGKTLHFEKAAEAAPKSYTLVWSGGQKGFAPDGKTLPLRSFSPTLNTLRQPTQVVVRSVDPKTRKVVTVTAGPSDLNGKAGAKSGAEVAEAAGRKAIRPIVTLPVATRAEAEAIAKSVFNELAASFVVGTGVSIGVPDLKAGVVVTLLGLGDRFNGDYYVTKATHTIGNAGYTTLFQVRRNAVG